MEKLEEVEGGKEELREKVNFQLQRAFNVIEDNNILVQVTFCQQESK